MSEHAAGHYIYIKVGVCICLPRSNNPAESCGYYLLQSIVLSKHGNNDCVLSVYPKKVQHLIMFKAWNASSHPQSIISLSLSLFFSHSLDLFHENSFILLFCAKQVMALKVLLSRKIKLFFYIYIYI